MTDYRAQLEPAVRAIRFMSRTRYTWFGHPRSAPAVVDPESARAFLIASLQSDLYFNFYTLGYPVPPGFQADASAFPDASLTAALSDANRGKGYWEPSWTVESASGPAVEVSRAGLHVWAPLDALRAEADGIVDGASVALRRRKELTVISPGFYTAAGDVDLQAGEEGSIVRLYWNVTPAGAVALMKAVTSRLNAAGMPFRFKAANHRSGYMRRDAAVLYFRATDYAEVTRLLAPAYRRLAAEIQPGTPALTREVASGVGFAEDPGPDRSFGQDRCRIIAGALLAAADQGLAAPSARLEVIDAHFQAAGLTLEAPYLNAGSTASYAAFQVVRGRRAEPRGRPPGDEVPPGALYETALAIAREIAAQAIWHNGACTWMGVAPGAGPVPDYASLGPDLYLGSSGIALFLAAIAARSGDEALREAAKGALRNALGRAESMPVSGPGLYEGCTGVALAAVRAGQALADTAIVERGAELARRALDATLSVTVEFDVIDGCAGAILGLLSLHSLIDEPQLLEDAIAMADGLLASADRAGSSLSWRSARRPDEAALTGLSHGAAGAALALVELFAATGAGRFADAARLAMAYEARWFDAEAGNWPDFRDVARGAVAHAPQRFATTWCHGAPGIALSRLRAHQVLGDAACLADAEIALAATRAAVRTAMLAPGGSLGLCHGLAGNADILLYAARNLDPAAPNLTMANAAATFIQDVARRQLRAIVSDSPGLMVGAAGPGYFLLRLLDPGLPSVLHIQPEVAGMPVSSPPGS